MKEEPLSPTLCRLCQRPTSQVGPIQQSHIIPRFILKMSRNNGKSVTFSLDKKEFAISQEDWKEQLLCTGCEKVMHGHEQLLNELLFLRRKKPVMFETADHTRLRARSDHVALGLVSVFWRAAISTHPAYVYPVLPDYMKDEMRSWLQAGRLPTNWFRLIEVKVQRIVFPGDDDGQLLPLIAPFIRQPDERRSFEFVFVCGGYCWTFTIPPSGDQIFSRSKAIRPAALSVHVANVHFSKIPELEELLIGMLETPMDLELEAKIRRFTTRRINRGQGPEPAAL